ncbi:MAG: hypothetical protein QT00_C0002G0322 [archaeon GW2011_AR5]|nr:MAG: hypothetical protein QT00_C0002G0322 [archaeon GW2011_AR5]
MNKIYVSALIFALFASVSFAASPYFFKGYVHVNGSLAPNGTIVEIFLNGTNSVLGSSVVGEGTLGGTPQGWYTVGFEGNSENIVSFRVDNLTPISANGTNVTAQTLGSGVIHDNFNLSVNKSSQGSSCLYAIGCSSGFCVDSYCCNSACGGASEDCNVAGSLGTCTSTASSSSSGGGGGSSTPSTTETLTVASVNAGAAATFTTTNAASLGVETIQFTSSVSATNVQVTVKEVKETAITTTGAISLASSDGAVYKYLEITKTGLQTSQMSSVKVNFKVPKSWLSSNNIDKNTVALNRYNNGWAKLATTIRSEDATYVYYAADTPGFSTFAITGEKGATFFELISKIDDYYAGRITFFALIDAIDLYYNSQ